MTSHPYHWSPDAEALVARLGADVARLRQTALDPAARASLQRQLRLVHVYNSNAIEGNRLTLRETQVVLEQGLTVAGKPLKDHLDAVNLAQGVDAVLSLVDDGGPLTSSDIGRLHSIVLRGDDAAGRYRLGPVAITGTTFTPPRAAELDQRMGELEAWLAGAEPVDPLLRASIAHTWLVTIHPFLDGNGRTARLLAALLLLRERYPFLILPVEDRLRYYEALDASHSGDLGPLIALFADRARSTLETYYRPLLEG